jgi:hypothetical protein
MLRARRAFLAGKFLQILLAGTFRRGYLAPSPNVNGGLSDPFADAPCP